MLYLYDDHDNLVTGQRVCKGCGRPFVLWHQERKHTRQRGHELPRHCRTCRRERRKQGAADAAGYRGPAFWRSA